MITEKQVREWCDKNNHGYSDLSTQLTLRALKGLGVLAEPQDKPLLGEIVAGEFPYNHRIQQLVAEHQAALDAFAEAVRRIECGESVCFDGVCRRIREALAAARKAGLTKVGA